MTADTPPWHPQYFRLTLRQFFFGTTLITLAVSHVASTQRNRELKRELDAVKRRAGFPIVEDKNVVYAARSQLRDRNFWRFRVYQPKGTKLVLKYRLHRIGVDEDRYIEAEGEVGLSSRDPDPLNNRAREFTLDVSIRDDREKITIESDRGIYCTIGVPKDHYFRRQQDGYRESLARSHGSGLPLCLIQLRERTVVPSDGLLMWLEAAEHAPE